MLSALDLRDQLPQIETPTQVIVSSNDRVVPPKAGYLLAERLPNARLIDREAGHVALIHPSVDLAKILADAEN
jgi:pimeloyl-ACP methyl ester carboxylesterase